VYIVVLIIEPTLSVWSSPVKSIF